MHGAGLAISVYPLHLGTGNDLYPIPLERFSHQACGVRIVVRKNAIAGFQHRDAAPETCKRLRQLASDRPPADHHQLLRALGQGKHRLIGQVPGLFKPRNGRCRRAGSGGDDRPSEVKPLPLHLKGVLGNEAGLAEKDIHPQLTLKARGAVHRAEVRPDATHALHHPGKVPTPACLGSTEALGAPRNLLPGTCGTEDSLGGDAPHVEAVPAQQFPLNQRYLCPKRGADRGGDEPPRAAPDHHQVVVAFGLRVSPGWRVHVFQQPLVVAIQRPHRGKRSLSRCFGFSGGHFPFPG